MTAAAVTDRWRDLVWPAARLGEAMEELARRAGLARGRVASGHAGRASPPDGALRGETLDSWLELHAARAGLEVEAVDADHGDARRMVRRAAPAIFQLRGDGPPAFLVVAGRSRRSLQALGPNLAVTSVDADEVLSAIRGPADPQTAHDVERVIDRAQLSGPRREAAREALLGMARGQTRTGGVWLLRARASASPGVQSREARLGGLLAALLGAHALQFVLWIVSWWLLGRAALAGRLDQGWLLGWGLLLLTLIPLHLISTWAGGLLSIRAGALLKRRLLQGAFQLDPGAVRQEGAGGLLGRVIEADAIEQMALAGGFLAATGSIESLLAAAVLSQGAGGALHAVLLLLWLGATAWLAAAYHRRRAAWTGRRLAMTNDLVESMVGHRTRLAQEDPASWNLGEDAAVASYVADSRRLDAANARLAVLAPRGWFVVGLLGLAPAFVWGGAGQVALAVGVGGVLLAYQALRHVADGLERWVAVHIAWRQVAEFWRASASESPAVDPGTALLSSARAATEQLEAATTRAVVRGPPLLDLRDVTFRYPGRAEPVLTSLELRLEDGDRVLLEGASGGGKSTLASILSGSRSIASGLILLGGLDRDTLGFHGWRRRAVLVPQFHDNHVFLGSFAFNALLGRSWPPSSQDLQEAEAVARALGLGPLLERMPSGVMQMVGETGWQLSHGERSRLFIARALLQRPDAMVLDESFAALDPETLKLTLEHVLVSARTLVVIAHP